MWQRAEQTAQQFDLKASVLAAIGPRMENTDFFNTLVAHLPKVIKEKSNGAVG